MPTLKTFTAEIGDASLQGRRAQPEDFSRGLNGSGHTLTKFAETMLSDTEEEESRKALVASSEVRAKYARALDEAALTGADTAKLKENMQTEFSKIGENFQTKKGTQSLQLYGSNTELMFDEQANRIRVTRAASEARLEGSKFLNSSSEILRSNPLYLPYAEKDAEAFASTLKNIAPEKRAEIAQGLKKELNMAAAVATARLDPEATKKRLESGEWDLTPAQREQATQRADSEVRARRADEAYQRAEKEHQIREADDKARDTHFGEIMGGTATRRAIMDDADLRPVTREHLIAVLELRAKEITGQEKKSDPQTVRDLWLRIHAPDTDPKKIFNGDAIFEAVQAGKVNTSDANGLNALVANQKDENNRSIGQRLAGLSSTVARSLSQDPQFAAQPALVAEIQNDYNARVLDKVKELRDAKTPPTDVFDPKSKAYVGSREFIQVSIDTARQRQSDSLPKPTVVGTQAEYDALQPGTAYVDSKGNKGVKKGAAVKAASEPAAAEDKPLPKATLHYISTRDGIPMDDLDPFTGKRKEPPAPAPLNEDEKKRLLKFDPARGGLVPAGT